MGLVEGRQRATATHEAAVRVVVLGVEHRRDPLGEGVVAVALLVLAEFFERLEPCAGAPCLDQRTLQIAVFEVGERRVGVQEHLLGGVAGVVERGVVGEEGQGLAAHALRVEIFDARVGAIEELRRFDRLPRVEKQESALQQIENVVSWIVDRTRPIALSRFPALRLADLARPIGVGAAADEDQEQAKHGQGAAD